MFRMSSVLTLLALLMTVLDVANAQLQAAPVCGNGSVEDGEDCEPPGVGGCNDLCKVPPPECGDNIVVPPEECEPPGLGSCSEKCRNVGFTPPPAPKCGDNIVARPDEDCEPPNVGRCDANCQISSAPKCGNRIVEPEEGEDCEPPGQGSCDKSCKTVACQADGQKCSQNDQCCSGICDDASGECKEDCGTFEFSRCKRGEGCDFDITPGAIFSSEQFTTDLPVGPDGCMLLAAAYSSTAQVCRGYCRAVLDANLPTVGPFQSGICQWRPDSPSPNACFLYVDAPDGTSCPASRVSCPTSSQDGN